MTPIKKRVLQYFTDMEHKVKERKEHNFDSIYQSDEGKDWARMVQYTNLPIGYMEFRRE